MSKTANGSSADDLPARTELKPKRFCGIVRPIAEMGSYPAKHWRDVHNVIAEAVEPLGFTLRLVSESDAAGVILTEIVSNLYEDEIVIVDVSGRNPNVMFELGMRLAFEKPAIIVMDDETPFSFDISPVKHIRYPRTLRYADVIKFKADVASAINATLEAGPEKKNYLQQFGPIKVTELGSQSIDLSALAQDVQELKHLMIGTFNRRDYLNAHEPMFEELLGYNGEDAESRISITLPSHLHDDFVNYAMGAAGVSEIYPTEDRLRVLIKGRPRDVSDTRNRLRSFARELRLAHGIA